MRSETFPGIVRARPTAIVARKLVAAHKAIHFPVEIGDLEVEDHEIHDLQYNIQHTCTVQYIRVRCFSAKTRLEPTMFVRLESSCD